MSLIIAPPMAYAQQSQDIDLRGAWATESYNLKDGTIHAVQGLIFFAEHDWTVLFFVMGKKADEALTAMRGSGEGGTYEIDGNRLTFHHQYHLSGGEAVQGLPASALRMETRAQDDAQLEESTFTIERNELTIFFPSGNSMKFRRRSF
jgi:hypothetical protein